MVEKLESYREMKERLVEELKNADWNSLNVDKLIDIKMFVEKNYMEVGARSQ